MDNESNVVGIDALVTPADINEILPKRIERFQLSSVLDDLTVEEYKSIFFLLMDYLGEEEFPNVIKQNKLYFKQKVYDILRKEKNDSIIIELLGTLKLYKKIRLLGTCHHLFKELQQKKFNNIDGVWKMFYALCEELTEIDLEILKQLLPENIRDQTGTLEEWFYWALQNNIISKTDFSQLEKILHNYQSCLDVITHFVKPKTYKIRTPTANTDCGIAVILNFETFSEKFPIREGSAVDVKSLTDVWNEFGFKTKVYNNLTCEETVNKLKYYANLDHSNYDVFVCCILSHGLSNSVFSSDSKEMPIPVLIGEITDNCSSLNSKPKLFFIQACQGTNIQQGFGKPVKKMKSPDMSETATNNLSTPPVTSDVLVAHSSIDGYVSFRDKITGSWFIQEFCNVMKQKGDKFSILDIMIEVNNNVREKSAYLSSEVKNAQQIVNCSNAFAKVLFLKKRTE